MICGSYHQWLLRKPESCQEVAPIGFASGSIDLDQLECNIRTFSAQYHGMPYRLEFLASLDVVCLELTATMI
jgi:hypothetical protein